MDELEKMFGEAETKEEKSENEISSSEKRKRSWEKFKKLYDWAKLPFELIIVVILVFSAYLMQQSIYDMTGNYFLSVLAPAFTEGAFVAAHLATDRIKNSIKQKEIASKLQWWQVSITVILLVLNLIVETTKEVISDFGLLTDENIRFAIFFFIGIDFLVLIISYIKYQNADEELNIKRTNAKKLQTIQTDTLRSKMDAYADAERIKSEEMVKFWKENAPELAKYQARLESAKEIKKTYAELGMTPEEATKLLRDVGFAEGEVVEDFQDSGKRQYNKTGKYKKPQLQAPKPVGENQTLLVERAKKLEEQED